MTVDSNYNKLLEACRGSRSLLKREVDSVSIAALVCKVYGHRLSVFLYNDQGICFCSQCGLTREEICSGVRNE